MNAWHQPHWYLSDSPPVNVELEEEKKTLPKVAFLTLNHWGTGVGGGSWRDAGGWWSKLGCVP
jgi:hypothetical protein